MRFNNYRIFLRASLILRISTKKQSINFLLQQDFLKSLYFKTSSFPIFAQNLEIRILILQWREKDKFKGKISRLILSRFRFSKFPQSQATFIISSIN